MNMKLIKLILDSNTADNDIAKDLLDDMCNNLYQYWIKNNNRTDIELINTLNAMIRKKIKRDIHIWLQRDDTDIDYVPIMRLALDALINVTTEHQKDDFQLLLSSYYRIKQKKQYIQLLQKNELPDEIGGALQKGLSDWCVNCDEEAIYRKFSTIQFSELFKQWQANQLPVTISSLIEGKLYTLLDITMMPATLQKITQEHCAMEIIKECRSCRLDITLAKIIRPSITTFLNIYANDSLFKQPEMGQHFIKGILLQFLQQLTTLNNDFDPSISKEILRLVHDEPTIAEEENAHNESSEFQIRPK